jgi:hypothetical protein
MCLAATERRGCGAVGLALGCALELDRRAIGRSRPPRRSPLSRESAAGGTRGRQLDCPRAPVSDTANLGRSPAGRPGDVSAAGISRSVLARSRRTPARARALMSRAQGRACMCEGRLEPEGGRDPPTQARPWSRGTRRAHHERSACSRSPSRTSPRRRAYVTARPRPKRSATRAALAIRSRPIHRTISLSRGVSRKPRRDRGVRTRGSSSVISDEPPATFFG